jgi:hypothetical protein
VIVVNKDLSKDELNKMGFESARSVDEAIDMAKNWHQQAEVAILPAGAETMTRLTP